MFSQKIIVIEGPTASGKTALAIALAQQLNTVIISSDSRQFYREMTIGTAKPSESELSSAKHYFIDSHSIHQPLSAGQFATGATKLLNSPELLSYEFVIVAGGSGMFTDALVNGLDELPTNPDLQVELQHALAANGLESLLGELKAVDPVYFDEVDKQNSRRILRAIEVIRLTNRPFSALRTRQNETPGNVFRFQLFPEREELYNRINLRVDYMIAKGLLDEARALHEFRELKPLQTVGYQELFSYFDGKTDLASAIDLIKQHTRNYAKRQMTWFRRKEAVVLTGNKEEQVEDILNLIKL